MMEGGRAELRRDVERVKLERWGIRRFRRRKINEEEEGLKGVGKCGNVVQGCLWPVHSWGAG